MGLFKFMKHAGERLGIGEHDDDEKQSQAIRQHVEKQGLGVENLEVKKQGGKVLVSGRAPSREALEKAVLAAGNVAGVEDVEANVQTAQAQGKADVPLAQGQAAEGEEAHFYTVKSGDTLSKIAKAEYGDANRYNDIFEANRPMLSDPDKIYPGQVLRIPQRQMAEA
jgi:nucleoid-associated protein YgaU